MTSLYEYIALWTFPPSLEHIYIYIYMCVYVCVRVWVRVMVCVCVCVCVFYKFIYKRFYKEKYLPLHRKVKCNLVFLLSFIPPSHNPNPPISQLPTKKDKYPNTYLKLRSIRKIMLDISCSNREKRKKKKEKESARLPNAYTLTRTA